MPRTIIMAEDVAAMAERGRLVIDDNTTVTASARELARRRGIELVESAGAAAGAGGMRGAPGAPGAPGAGARGSAGGAAGGGMRGAAGRAAAAQAATDAVLEGQREGAPFVGGGVPGTIIVTAIGVNRPGVMAELTTAVGELGGDIQDVSQRLTGGYFNAILVVDIARSGQSFAAYRDALKALSEPNDYVVTVIDERVFTAMHRLG
ncbi:MAG TPA: ACT domain-containing protein [Planctomycetota bacterium]|nr:ACT domain-containing protein [Planctomycetota bacterium]